MLYFVLSNLAILIGGNVFRCNASFQSGNNVHNVLVVAWGWKFVWL